MRSSVNSALLVTLFGLAAASATPQGPAIYDVTVAKVERFAEADVSRMTPALVTRHVDGDTFEVRIENPPPGPGSSEKVRLIGIDTPESGEPWAEDALRHVVSRVGTEPVYLAFDFRRRDRFDRLLAYVYLPDGTLLNADLIAAGLARVYRRDKTAYFFAQFERLETDARGRRRGVWTDHPGGIVILFICNAGLAEHALLSNDSSVAVDLSGWRIEDDDRSSLTIPDAITLAPHETLAICSGAGCVGKPQAHLQLSKQNIWGNDGDTAFLFDADGRQVASFSY